MEECRTCELAVYCFTEESSWVFRTLEEMREKKAAMARCPLNARGKGRSEARVGKKEGGCGS